MTEPHLLTATEAARQLQAGSLTATALMESCLSAIAAREPVLRAFAALEPGMALAQAQEADAARRAGSPMGPLFGLPLGVKDVLDTAQLPSAYGSPIWAGWQPRGDAAAVALARRKGAIVVGKTVTTEFATRLPGPTTNPANPAHTPGGSSSGSAAAVGAGMIPFAYGTQTAGSVIRPAAYCGAVGYKPSFGTIHRWGMKVMSESLDTIGVMARSVADCALLVGAVADQNLGDPGKHTGRAPRIALCIGHDEAAVPAETRALLENVAQAASRAGASIHILTLPAAVAEAAVAHPYVMNMESAQALAWEIAAASAELSAGLLERMEWAREQPAERLLNGRLVFASAQAAFTALMADYDVVLTPSAQGEAPAGLEWTGDPVCNMLWTALHAPCVTIPAGVGAGGLPVGAQLVTAPGKDREVLAWAAWLAAAL